MQLTTLLEKWITLPADFAIPIHDLAINSQQVKPGDVFFAMPGSKQDGFIFVDEAIEQGAVAIIADGEIAQADYYRSIPLIRLPKLRMLCSAIAAEYFDRPSAKMTVIGITGTNGKTSCAYFLAAAFTQLGKIAGYMGTLGCGIYGQNIVETGLTTADPITIQRILAQFNVAGANVVAMEVSSHALAQSRVAGVTFTCAILTNLTQDHLDYHGTMDAYWAAKKLLFQEFHIQHAIINADDPYGRSLLTELAESSICGYTQNALDESLMPMVQASAIQFSSSGIVAQLHTPVGTGQLVSKMLGRFNLANILAVLTTLITLDVPLPEALACVEQLPLVPGRMQVYRANSKPTVIVDYAHTPDALENVLTTLREICSGKLWCVFGCGGDRDKTKRPMMGAIAEKLADYIIITDDNPRTESAQNIVADVLTGISSSQAAMIEHNRLKAITYAIHHAKPDDLILVAGKGHEHYQEINQQRYPFNDGEVVQQLLSLL